MHSNTRMDNKCLAFINEQDNPDEVAFTKENQDSYYYAHFF